MPFGWPRCPSPCSTLVPLVSSSYILVSLQSAPKSWHASASKRSENHAQQFPSQFTSTPPRPPTQAWLSYEDRSWVYPVRSSATESVHHEAQSSRQLIIHAVCKAVCMVYQSLKHQCTNTPMQETVSETHFFFILSASCLFSVLCWITFCRFSMFRTSKMPSFESCKSKATPSAAHKLENSVVFLPSFAYSHPAKRKTNSKQLLAESCSWGQLARMKSS